MHALRLVPLLPLVACASDDIGLQEQQAAITAVRALEAAVLAVEIAAPAQLGLDEDATTCPGMSVIEGYISLDYADCVPTRGWVRPALEGALRLDLTPTEFETSLDALAVDDASATGRLSGTLGPGGTVRADLALTAAVYDAVELDLTATLARTAVLSGTITLIADGRAQDIVVSDVEVPSGTGCFVAVAGTATLEQGITDVTVSFNDDGSAQATNDRGDSGFLDICGLDATLWTETTP